MRSDQEGDWAATVLTPLLMIREISIVLKSCLIGLAPFIKGGQMPSFLWVTTECCPQLTDNASSVGGFSGNLVERIKIELTRTERTLEYTRGQPQSLDKTSACADFAKWFLAQAVYVRSVNFQRPLGVKRIVRSGDQSGASSLLGLARILRKNY